MIDEKRHFQKPIELSPLVAIDRERCILCYRCVRFSQEVSEDAELQLLERGDRTFVGTFDDRPYVAPFHGNITELCPVGALTNYTYRFRARPWDIEQAGSVCTLCPSQCNVSFTVRDEKVKRVLARDNAEVDDGWLCDRGRYGFEMFADEQRVDGPRLKGGAATDWDAAIEAAAPGLLRAGEGKVAAIVGDASNEEAFLVQRLLREALGSAARRLAPLARPRPRGAGRGSPQPELSAPGRATSTRPTRSSSSAPTRCTARRSSTCASARRSAATAPASRSRPSARPRSTAAPRRSPATPPGEATDFLSGSSPRRCAAARENVAEPAVAEVAARRRRASSSSGASGSAARARADSTRCSASPAPSTSPATDGSGLLEVPDFANARGLREAGCLPDAGPGLARASAAGRATEEIRAALESGELEGARPLRRRPAARLPRHHGLGGRAHRRRLRRLLLDVRERDHAPRPTSSSRSRPTPRKTAPSPTPTAACSASAPAPRRPGDVRPNIQVLAELSPALGHDTGIDSQPSAFAALTASGPLLRLASTTQAIGGRGIRWQDTPARPRICPDSRGAAPVHALRTSERRAGPAGTSDGSQRPSPAGE